jgi:propionaldehyde dehydrogenase
MDITQQDLELIIKKVLDGIRQNGAGAVPPGDASGGGQLNGSRGVFERPEDAIAAAHFSQQVYARDYGIQEREAVLGVLRRDLLTHVEELSGAVFEETGIGVYADKIAKHRLVITGTPGTEILRTEAISGNNGLTLTEYAPFGLIGAVTPVTNPTETIINNVISMLAGGNAVVFNVHPSAVKSSALSVGLIHDALKNAGAPENLVTMIAAPTMETLKVIIAAPQVRLLLGTGGMAMVKSLLSSGKKTIGAGAGNPPVIVDETADIPFAAKQIYSGASFDNNILCIAEKEVFSLSPVTDDLIHELQKNGAYLLTEDETIRVTELTLQRGEDGEYHPKKQWVGKDARAILAAAGISGASSAGKLLIAKTGADHPLVMTEQMLPVLPIVDCDSFEKALEWACRAERGNRHTASIFSGSVERITAFSKRIETTIFVANNNTLAGVGFGGEGFATMTIAGPTGEGITSALTFSRRRRAAFANGSLRMV